MKLVTCGLPYANGKAHIGHLRTYIPADVYVKYLRMLGEKVIFICGSDCHGTPIVVNAEKEGVTPQELVNKYHEHFIKIFKALEIEFDFFGRTDAEYNHKRTQEIVKKLIDNGYVYAKEIELSYCPKCQRFLPDRYVEGICPYCGSPARGDECDQGCGRHLEPGEILDPKCKICGTKAILKKQKHYFFKLSAFKDFLMDFLNNLNGTENAINYAKEWVKKELKDWCITRNLEWGVKFPGEENLVVYVWVDAPIGYISFTEEASKKLGFDWKEIWLKEGDITHFIGLDIVYHHCIFWPALLKAAGYKLPKNIVASGMVKVEGKTFSKSRGYVVWVDEDYLLQGLNPDYLRFYIVNYTSHQKDLNFSWKEFRDKVNNELVANLGNFIYRVLHFAWKNFGEIEIDSVDNEILNKIQETKNAIINALKVWEFKALSDAFMSLAVFGNNYFQSKEPWNLIKKDKNECKKVISSCLQLIKAIVIFSYPVLPKTMKKLSKIFEIDVKNAKIDDALKITRKLRIDKPEIPFEKIDDEKIKKLESILINRIKKRSREETSEIEKELVTIDDFKKLKIKIGKILEAERIKGSKKLIKLIVDIGGETRQIVAGIAEQYSPEDLVNKLVPILVNIKPATIMGVESQGMLLAINDNNKPVLLLPEKDVKPGSEII